MTLSRLFLLRSEWIAWAVLVLSLGAGIGQDIGTTPSGAGVGEGYQIFDITMTVTMWCALTLQVGVKIMFHPVECLTDRIANWLLLIVTTVFSFRFAWMLWTLGDIFAPLITITAFLLYAISQILHSLVVINANS